VTWPTSARLAGSSVTLRRRSLPRACARRSPGRGSRPPCARRRGTVHEHWHEHVSSIHVSAGLIAYLYFAITLYVVAEKTRAEGAILAFIPCLSVIPLLNSSRRSFLWLILLFIPPITIVAIAWIMMGICEAR